MTAPLGLGLDLILHIVPVLLIPIYLNIFRAGGIGYSYRQHSHSLISFCEGDIIHQKEEYPEVMELLCYLVICKTVHVACFHL